MKTIIATLIIFLNSQVIAQDNIINIQFEVDGKPLNYQVSTVKFIYNNDTLTLRIEKGNLNIPPLLLKKNATIIFYIDNYILQFDSIPITFNKLYPYWSIGLDEKPFEDKNLWMIKHPKKVKVFYYFKDNYGRIFSVFCYKKFCP